MFPHMVGFYDSLSLFAESQSYSRRLAALSLVEPEFQVPPLARTQEPFTRFRAGGSLCFY